MIDGHLPFRTGFELLISSQQKKGETWASAEKQKTPKKLISTRRYHSLKLHHRDMVIEFIKHVGDGKLGKCGKVCSLDLVWREKVTKWRKTEKE